MSSIAIAELITIAAGATATYRNVKRTHGPRERAFAIWANIVCWIFAFGFLLSIRFIPKSFLVLYSGISVVILIAGVTWWTARQRQIQEAESPGAPLTSRGVRQLTQLSSLSLALLVIAVSLLIARAARTGPFSQDVSHRLFAISVIFLLGSCVSLLLHRKLDR